MNIKLICVVTIIILCSISSAGCIFSIFNDSYHKFYYEIELQYSGNAEVLLPIPFDYPNIGDIKSNYSSRLIDNLNLVSGNGNYDVNITEKGIALKINFTNEIHLISEKKFSNIDEKGYDDYFFDGISMQNGTSSHNAYFYSNQNNVTIKLFKCYIDRVGTRDSDMSEWNIENHSLSKGWNVEELKH